MRTPQHTERHQLLLKVASLAMEVPAGNSHLITSLC